jgi:molybdenum cofactor synthesis domain-containing protein
MNFPEKLPDKLQALVITLSDRAHSGIYTDRSGPKVKEMLSSYLSTENWDHRIDLTLLPDNSAKLRELILMSPGYDLIITTGATGIGPKDITVDTISPLLSKQIPGIMEFIRLKYGMEKPNALLSRSVAGITGKSLIYTLPGSVTAVEEYMTEILKTLKHIFYMMYGIDTH